MITDKAFMGICTALDTLLPPECGFALVVFKADPKRVAFLPATEVDVVCAGSIHDATWREKQAVAVALHGLADQLSADQPASDGLA